MLLNNSNSKKKKKMFEKFIGWLRLNRDNAKEITSRLFNYQIIEFIQIMFNFNKVIRNSGKDNGVEFK